MMTLNICLRQGITDLGLEISASSQAKLICFIELIQKWNRTFNLTAIRQREEMVSHHLLDSLSIANYVSGPHILDIGSGAGLPGIPLAISLPQYQFVLLDSQGKKTRFLLQVKNELDLPNVEIVQERVEHYQPGELFNEITARAFGSVHDIISLSKHLLLPKGQWLLMRGQVMEEELSGIKGTAEIVPLKVPGLNKQRSLVLIRKFAFY